MEASIKPWDHIWTWCMIWTIYGHVWISFEENRLLSLVGDIITSNNLNNFTINFLVYWRIDLLEKHEKYLQRIKNIMKTSLNYNKCVLYRQPNLLWNVTLDAIMHLLNIRTFLFTFFSRSSFSSCFLAENDFNYYIWDFTKKYIIKRFLNALE